MTVFKNFFKILLITNIYIILFSFGLIKHNVITSTLCFIFWFLISFTLLEILHSFYVKPKPPEKNSAFAEKMAKYYKI